MSAANVLQHLGHTLIRASAGTGKTHALVARYVQWVAEGVEPQHIVAITFTRRAAGELRGRIRAALLAAGAGDGAISQLAFAPITNFHGLCLRLCEEFWPGGLGEGAVHVLGDSGEDKQLFLEACESVWFARTPKVAAALEALGPWMRLDTAFMGQLWEALSLARESAQPLTEALFGQYDAQALQARVHQQLCALRDRILQHDQVLTTPAALRVLSHLQETPVPKLPATAGGDATAAWQKAWQAIFAPVNRKGRMGQVVSPEDLEAVATLLPAVAAERQAGALVPALHTLVQAAWHAYAAAKTARGALDFADLIERTIALLDQHPDIHRLVRQRIRAVLVDEAQDTNALQRKLVRLLAGMDGAALGEAPAATTVVGDWKQAIYTFRGADPHNFARFADDVHGLGGRSESLDISYRSVAPLVAGINHLGAHLFHERYEALVAQPDEASAPAPRRSEQGVGMHWLAVQRPDGERLTLADDAWATAHYVGQLVRAGTPPQEIAVLMAHVRGPAPVYLQAFAQEGIPVVASGTGDLLEQPHIAELLALCAWLCDPTRELEGAIALSSPLFGVDDDALYFLWGSPGRGSARAQALRQGQLDEAAAQALDPAGQAALSRAAAVLPALIAQAAHLPMTAMLEELDALLQVRALLGAEPTARAQRLADFDALMHLADHAQRQGFGQVADFVSHLMWRRAQGFLTAQGESQVAERQAVLLSSVHASKGLQYPIVVLPALERRGQSSSGQLVFERQLGLAFALQAGRERLKPQRFLRAIQNMAEARQDELRRLIYVAVTRAKKQITFVGPPPHACGSTGFAGIIAPWAAGAPQELLAVTSVQVPQGAAAASLPPKPWRPAADEAPQAMARLGDLLAPAAAEPLPEGTLLEVSVSALLDVWQQLTQDGHEPARPAAAQQQGPSPEPQGAEAGLGQEQAGTLAHALMSRLDDAASYDTLQGYLAAALRFLGHDPAAQGMAPLMEDLLASLASPLGQKLVRAPPDARRFEMDFIWRGQILGYTVHLRGQVDALLREPNGCTLIDFKYGWPSGHNSRYAQQLQLYAWALRALHGEGPTEGQLFYLKAPHRPRPVPIDAAACAWVPEALAAWVRQHGAFAAKAWHA